MGLLGPCPPLAEDELTAHISTEIFYLILFIMQIQYGLFVVFYIISGNILNVLYKYIYSGVVEMPWYGISKAEARMCRAGVEKFSSRKIFVTCGSAELLSFV